MNEKCILYLRTDIWDAELTAGGSVAHTIGVIQGFVALGYSVVCVSSCVKSALDTIPLERYLQLSNPACLKFLRWKLNCFLSSFFFFFQTRGLVKVYPILCIYQRYSLLNVTGVLLAWWYKKKLILEYNGSEAWTALYWAEKKYSITGKSFMYMVEQINIKCADSIVVVSQALKDELESKGIQPKKILVNPNGVDAMLFWPSRVQGSKNE